MLLNIEIGKNGIKIHPFGARLDDWCVPLDDHSRIVSYDSIAVGCVDDYKISSIQYDNLMNRLIKDGYQDTVLNDYKLKIYNYNIQSVKKYYNNDRYFSKHDSISEMASNESNFYEEDSLQDLTKTSSLPAMPSMSNGLNL